LAPQQVLEAPRAEACGKSDPLPKSEWLFVIGEWLFVIDSGSFGLSRPDGRSEDAGKPVIFLDHVLC